MVRSISPDGTSRRFHARDTSSPRGGPAASLFLVFLVVDTQPRTLTCDVSNFEFVRFYRAKRVLPLGDTCR